MLGAPNMREGQIVILLAARDRPIFKGSPLQSRRGMERRRRGLEAHQKRKRAAKPRNIKNCVNGEIEVLKNRKSVFQDKQGEKLREELRKPMQGGGKREQPRYIEKKL